METEKLENPFIRVIWEDIPGNFTKERLRRVKSYFQKKYNSKKCYGSNKITVCRW